MKIIDLLNKIANGEETPQKFYYNDLCFEKDRNMGYYDNDCDSLCDSLLSDFSNLNDEIEISIRDYKKLYDNLENQKHEIIEYIKSFEYYIPEDDKNKLLQMLGEKPKEE